MGWVIEMTVLICVLLAKGTYHKCESTWRGTIIADLMDNGNSIMPLVRILLCKLHFAFSLFEFRPCTPNNTFISVIQLVIVLIGFHLIPRLYIPVR